MHALRQLEVVQLQETGIRVVELVRLRSPVGIHALRQLEAVKLQETGIRVVEIVRLRSAKFASNHL